MKMNLADPELELIDPTPNVHSLFIHFDKLFFSTTLANRAVVRWSKRMYSCAGVCSYMIGGICDIALSEPLLKLRPRKDLVETLLHEMIHAFLFITSRDQDRNGHGPNFIFHMYRINKLAGVNITIYHDFHDEVKLYQTHWWRCNGPCQTRRPYFGIIRRTVNKQPGPNDYWWQMHQNTCGGTFIKIKEPKFTAPKKVLKPQAGITNYINNNNNVINKNVTHDPKELPKGVLNDRNNAIMKINNKSNNNSSNVRTQNGTIFSPGVTKRLPPTFSGNGQIGGNRQTTQSATVVENVRNMWVNKQLSTVKNDKLITSRWTNIQDSNNSTNNYVVNSNKHKSCSTQVDFPPKKIKKIDDYFEKVARTILKDLYGDDFKISQSKTDNKLIVDKAHKVDCPICNIKLKDDEINRHLDECLNKDILEKLSKNTKPIHIIPTVVPSNNVDKMKTQTVDTIVAPTQPSTPGSYVCDSTKLKHPNIEKRRFDDSIDLTNISPIKKQRSSIKNNMVTQNRVNIDTGKPMCGSNNAFNEKDGDRVGSITKKVNLDDRLQKSSSFVEPAIIIDDEIKLPIVKIEPGTSKDVVFVSIETKCPCCGNKINNAIEEHLDECLAFFDNNKTIPEEGASTSFANETIVIDDDDDIFDETQTLNVTGTKFPCPCCLQMVEQVDMNNHLDICLSS